MNKPQFTPGPWRFWDFPDRPSNYDLARLTSANGRPILVCYGGAGGKALGTSEESQANTRLIASAPDLLAALAGCADALREAGKDFAQANKLAARPNLYELHEQAARAAIAKATATK